MGSEPHEDGSRSPRSPVPEDTTSVHIEAVEGDRFFAGYHLLEPVGSGGAAHVFRARHVHPRFEEQRFAVKLLMHELDNTSPLVALFRSESYLDLLLRHPNIVRAYETGVENGVPFIAMELIEGRDLARVVDHLDEMGRSVPRAVALHILGEVLEALVYAHELTDADQRPLGVVHRDVNPSNVLIAFDGAVKLGDFGVAAVGERAVVDENHTVGSLGYLAPEQMTGGRVDARADQFSFGAMMYEVLGGEPLFYHDDRDALIRLNRQARLPSLSFDPPLAPKLVAVLRTCLQKKPEKRFATSRELLAALRPHLPQPAATRLAVASLMRETFVGHFLDTIEERRGLGSAGPDGPSLATVGVCVGPEGVRNRVVQLLQRESVEAPQLSPDTHAPPALDAIVCDLDTNTVERVRQWVTEQHTYVPVVALSEDFCTETIVAAHRLGALDLLRRPVERERLHAALRLCAVVRRRRPIATEKRAESQPIPVLMVSTDASLIARLDVALPQWGYRIESAGTCLDALDRLESRTFHAAIYDVGSDLDAGPEAFVAGFRAAAAMGQVPVLFLSDGPMAERLTGLRRTACRPRNDLPALVASALTQLRADSGYGRAFRRYRASLPIELHHGGRSVRGTAADISRAGVLAYCDSVPPMGSRVTARLRLPERASFVNVTARVSRVDHPHSATADKPGVGLSFEPLARRDEGILLAYLRELAADP